jgi:hypothetical protein
MPGDGRSIRSLGRSIWWRWSSIRSLGARFGVGGDRFGRWGARSWRSSVVGLRTRLGPLAGPPWCDGLGGGEQGDLVRELLPAALPPRSHTHQTRRVGEDGWEFWGRGPRFFLCITSKMPVLLYGIKQIKHIKWKMPSLSFLSSRHDDIMPHPSYPREHLSHLPPPSKSSKWRLCF